MVKQVDQIPQNDNAEIPFDAKARDAAWESIIMDDDYSGANLEDYATNTRSISKKIKRIDLKSEPPTRERLIKNKFIGFIEQKYDIYSSGGEVGIAPLEELHARTRSLGNGARVSMPFGKR